MEIKEEKRKKGIYLLKRGLKQGYSQKRDFLKTLYQTICLLLG